MDSGHVLFEINKPLDDEIEEAIEDEESVMVDAGESNQTDAESKTFTPRFIRYYFKPSFLDLRSVFRFI